MLYQEHIWPKSKLLNSYSPLTCLGSQVLVGTLSTLLQVASGEHPEEPHKSIANFRHDTFQVGAFSHFFPRNWSKGILDITPRIFCRIFCACSLIQASLWHLTMSFSNHTQMAMSFWGIIQSLVPSVKPPTYQASDDPAWIPLIHSTVEWITSTRSGHFLLAKNLRFMANSVMLLFWL